MNWEDFTKKLNFLRERKASYLKFKAISGVPFLYDLANFCSANAPCVIKDKTGKSFVVGCDCVAKTGGVVENFVEARV